MIRGQEVSHVAWRMRWFDEPSHSASHLCPVRVVLCCLFYAAAHLHACGVARHTFLVH